MLSWIKDKTLSPELKVIDCQPFDDLRDFVMDECYVLIRVDSVKWTIELAVCNRDHVIVMVFRGRRCQDIYHELFKHDYIKLPDHMAYIGKELKKAEWSLVTQFPYYQE